MKLMLLSISPKTANKSYLTSKLFFDYLQDIIEIINTGDIPMLNAPIERLLKAETESKTRKIIDEASNELENIRERLPMSENELTSRYTDVIFEHVEKLREQISYIASKEIYSRNLRLLLDSIKEKYSDLDQENRFARSRNTTQLMSTFNSNLPRGVELPLEDPVSVLRPLYTTYFAATPASVFSHDW